MCLSLLESVQYVNQGWHYHCFNVHSYDRVRGYDHDDGDCDHVQNNGYVHHHDHDDRDDRDDHDHGDGHDCDCDHDGDGDGDRGGGHDRGHGDDEIFNFVMSFY